MRKIVIIDNRESFMKDISTRLLLGEDYDFEIVDYQNDLNKFDKLLESKEIDEICINSEFISSRNNWEVVGPKITTYSTTMQGVKESMDNRILTYGVIKNTGELLELINNNAPVLKTNDEEKTPGVKTDTSDEKNRNEIDDLLGEATSNVSVKENTPVDEPVKEAPKSSSIDDLLNGTSSNNQSVKQEKEQIKEQFKEENANSNAKEEDLIENLQNSKRAKSIKEKMLEEEEQNKLLDYSNADEIIRKRKKKKTEVIAVYSAKGGVGKTTIACNLAAYISMLSNGRRKYKVCVIDYNFDFGDVRHTLGLSSDGPTMSEWVEDIQMRLGNGEKAENILYKKDEIFEFLQKKNYDNEDIELYALLAPKSHKASLLIHNEELSIMINNIINYGEFDYIICDTGNNTRNSSILSLENANKILVVVTQDVTTVYDNDTFLEAIESIRDIDEDNISLVINRARSMNETKISCKEIEEQFDNIPCVATIKENADVTKANNYGKQLVRVKNHEFTKEIGNIATMITGATDYQPVKYSVVDKVKDFFGF